jgi:hypothetical protein
MHAALNRPVFLPVHVNFFKTVPIGMELLRFAPTHVHTDQRAHNTKDTHHARHTEEHTRDGYILVFAFNLAPPFFELLSFRRHKPGI